ncbi:unnamed protein product [Cuscuta campestris]|uniref:Uncharacterized protein n=1 Tax=Cuscuta campestris TaxID=132261 RepID=A0A484MQM2_9ASTE|nr:unnamed protein product [Cuscuta campestris]
MELGNPLSLKRCRQSTSKKESSLKRRRRSTPERALSDRMRKLLEGKISFPNLSKGRRKYINHSIVGGDYQRPHPRPLKKECKIGSYFDSECPFYSKSFTDLPKVEEGKPLNVLDLLGHNLLRFSTSSQNVHSTLPTKFTSYVGSRDLNMGYDRGMRMPNSGMSIPGKGHSNVLRGQSPVLRRCVNSLSSGVLASTTSTTTGTVKATMESTLSLMGKYVMICCVFVPSIWSSKDGPRVYHASLASHELARRDDFVLVVVPMMRSSFTRSYSAYQHFLSGFSCHAVPFEDSHRREYICSALGFDGEIKCLILDPSQEVLYHGWLLEVFDMFGGAEHDCFPFTLESVNNFDDRDDVFEDRSLNELLGLSDTDFLYNIEYLAGSRLREDSHITISDLKQKFVGLYVYSDGTSLRALQELHEKCRSLKHELEIVV